MLVLFFFFFSSRRRHTRLQGDWSSDVCSSDLIELLHMVFLGELQHFFGTHLTSWDWKMKTGGTFYNSANRTGLVSKFLMEVINKTRVLILLLCLGNADVPVYDAPGSCNVCRGPKQRHSAGGSDLAGSRKSSHSGCDRGHPYWRRIQRARTAPQAEERFPHRRISEA